MSSYRSSMQFMNSLFCSISLSDYQIRVRGQKPVGLQPAATSWRDEDGERIPVEAEGQQIPGGREDGEKEVSSWSQWPQATH